MEKRTSDKINLFKGWLLILVVLAHTKNLNDPTIVTSYFTETIIANTIPKIVNPVYFIISGYLFFLNFEFTSTAIIKKYTSRFKSIFIPYILWNGIMILLIIGVSVIKGKTEFSIGGLHVSPTFTSLFNNMFMSDYPVLYPLWFLRDLIILVILSPVIYIGIKKLGKLIFIPILIILIKEINFGPLSYFSIFYFVIGSYLGCKKSNLKLSWKLSKIQAVLLSILWLLICVVDTYVMHLSNFPINYTVSELIVGITGMIVLWSIADLLSDEAYRKALVIMPYSFFIYLSHGILIFFIEHLLANFNFANYMYLPVYFFTVASEIIILITIAKLMKKNKFTNKIFCILTGSRTQ